jgi:UDP-N-acetylmuramate dehydrogenase
MVIREKVSLKSFNTWLVGGPAERLVEPRTLDEVVDAVALAREKSWPLYVLGGGSNVLISDSGLDGLTIALGKFSGLQVEEEGRQIRLTVLAGTAKSELLRYFLKKKLSPALFLAGLPGDCGGGVVMNAGVSENFHPREFGEIVESVEVLRPDGSLEEISTDRLRWTYRHCEGWKPGVIVRVRIVWSNVQEEGILEKVKEANKARLQKQPLDWPSCGSVFVNPPGKKAAQLIDSCGLKGYSIGGAQVSQKHANFIINTGEATADDIWQVIKQVQKTVKHKTGVQLHTEVIFLGEGFS